MSELNEEVGTQLVPDDRSLDHIGKSNKNSLYHRLTPRFQEALDRIPVDYFSMDEFELEQKVKPTPVLNCIRFRVWEEFAKAIERGGKIKVKDIAAGICTEAYLYSAVFRNPIMVAWISRPPISYQQAAEEALNFGVKQVRRMLEFPLYTQDGKPDHKTAKLILEAVKMLDVRVKGSPVQHHNIRQQSVTVNATAREIAELKEDHSMESIDAQLVKLDREAEKEGLLPKRPALKEYKKRDEIEVELKDPVKPSPKNIDV